MSVAGVELATAYVSLTVDGSGVDSGVRRSLSGVSAHADRVGRDSGKKMGAGISGGVLGALKNIAGPMAAIFAGIGVGKVIGDSITAGSDFEQALGGAEAVFKKSAAGIKKTAEGAASSLGLTKTEYLEFATVLGAGLKNKGVGDFAKESGNLIKVGADLAAQFGGSTKDAVDALSSAMRGESDPIERYGVSLNETAVNAKLVEMGMKKINGKFTEQQKTAGRLALITQQTADAQGAFARESDTLAGKQARLKATFGDIKTELGTALLPALTSVADWFQKKGVPAIRGFVTFVTTKLIPGIGALKDLIVKGDFTGALRDAFGWAEDSRAVGFILGVRDGILRIKDTAKGLFDLFAKGDFTSALRKGLGVEEDSKVVDFLFDIRDGAIEAWDRLKQFGSFLKNDLWPALKEAYEVIAPALKSAFGEIAGAFGPGDGTSTDWAKFGDILTQKVIPFIAKMVEVYLPLWAQHIKTVIGAVKLAWQAFETWRDIMATVAGAILGSFIKITEAFQFMLETLGKVPGFGWARDAAAAMQPAIDKAKGIKEAIDRIPKSKTVNITVHESYKATGTGRFSNGGVGYAPGRATGGPVIKGQPYIVGEKRPELFIPNQSGRIVPRVPDSGSGAAVGDSSVRDAQMARMIANELQYVNLAVGVSEVDQSLSRQRRRGTLSSPGR